MKIRKFLALLVALSMAMAVMPAFGLTASAAISIGQGIVTSTGEAYAANSDDLIFDGSFESDNWEDVLTTGSYVDSSGGEAGVENAIKMNTDETMLAHGETAFVRVEGRTGKYAISPAFYAFTPGTPIPRYTNDENGPTSIKHYIENTSTGRKASSYYVSFWVKALTEEPASFRYYIGGIKEDATIPSSQSMTVSGDEWVHVDVVASVDPGDYLLINIFDMGENVIALDDFEACIVTQSADSKTFADATSQWATVFKYNDGQLISEDMVLPKASGKATVTWESSDPDLVDPATGKIALVKDDTPVTLWATLTYRALSYTYTYNFTVEGFLNRIRSAVTSNSFVEKYADPRAEAIVLPDTVPGFEGSVVTWESSDPSVIANDGTYNVPDGVGQVTLTATVTFAGETIVQDIVIYVGAALKHSLIENGAFEVVEGDIVPGWTVGDLSPMNVGANGTFEYVTDPDTGNHYILSKNHESWDGTGSIRLYVDLEPGKFYNLSFKIWYNGAASCQELYTAAVLMPNQTQNINEGGYGSTGTYGGFPYPGNSYNGRLTKADSWQTVNVGLLRPDAKYNTLLISAEWLNKKDGGLTDGRWAFDDFILEEIVSDFNANVTINYLDHEGNKLKDPKTVRNQYGNIEYYAESTDKADITVGTGSRKRLYRYDPTSVDHVLVQRNASENVINLYFNELISSEVTINYIDRETGNSLKKSVTEKSEVYVGYSYTAGAAHKADIMVKNVNYVYDETSEDTIIVAEDKNENVIDLYFSASDNIIINGDFKSGTYNGWTTRTGLTLSGGSFAYDNELGKMALTISPEGRTAATSIGTYWTVTPGKKYYLSFWVGGSKPSADNYQYNRVTDAYKTTDVRECAGNGLVEFGADMINGQWNHFELTFTAKTSVVYFQSSWVKEIKFADFVLKEIDESKVGTAVIRFLDAETGAAVGRADERVEGLVAGMTYTVPDEYKADFEYGDYLYQFVADKSDASVKIEDGKESVANLYFRKVSAADVTIKFIDRATGKALKDAVTVPAEIGKAYTAGSEYKATITVDGTYYVYDGASSKDTITVSQNAADNVITLYFNATNNMIINGDFETALEGNNIPNWTVGGADGINGVAQMTTANFTVETEADGNHYLKSIKSQSLTDPGSLKKFVTGLTPGKSYNLSFRIKRLGGAKLTESWVGAALVKDDGLEIRENNTDAATIAAYRATYGSIIPEKNGTDMFLLSPDDGWYTVQTTLTPDDTFKTLLISAKWLDGNWAFDDFMLTELNTDVKGTVTINYLNGDAEGTPALKAPKVVEDLVAGTVYTASDEDKASITVDGVTYFYDAASSNPSVTVIEGNNVINLYFRTRAAKSVADITIDAIEGGSLTLPKTAVVTFTDGSTEATEVAWNNDEIPSALVGGEVYEITGTVAGLDIKATVTVFYKATAPAGYENATWVGGSVKYPAAENASNRIADGTFSEGVIGSQWTDALGNALSANFKVDTTGAYSKVGNSIYGTASGGGSAAGTMRTYFPVEPGKSYVLSYDVYAPVNINTNGPERMSANALTRANYFGNYDNYGGELYLDFTVTGGNNSWSPNAYSTGNAGRVDMPFYKGFNEVEFTFANVPADAKYIAISHAQNVVASPLYFSNFQLYEIATDAVSFNPEAAMVKVTLIVNGVETVTYVEKGSKLPDYQAQYPGEQVTVQGSTNEPNVVVIVGEIPMGAAVVTIDAGAVTVAADGASVNGTLVIAQYNADKELVKVQTTEVTVSADSSKEIKYTTASGAVEVKAMLLKSIASLVPLAVAASYEPTEVPDEPVDTKPYLNSTFTLTAYGTDKVLTAGSRPLVLAEYTGSDLQKWSLEDDYFLKNIGSKDDNGTPKYMDISGQSREPGATIGVWIREGNYGDTNQQWIFEFDGDGYYIRSNLDPSYLYLTIVDGGAQQQPKEKATKWIVTPVE